MKRGKKLTIKINFPDGYKIRETDTPEMVYMRINHKLCAAKLAAEYSNDPEWAFEYIVNSEKEAGDALIAGTGIEEGELTPEKIKEIKARLEKLEEVHNKAFAFSVEAEMEGMPLDETEKEITEVHMENAFEEAFTRIEEWEKQLAANLPELAPGAETGEDTAEEVAAKLYRNIVNVRGFFKNLTTVRTEQNSTINPLENSLTIAGDKNQIIIKDFINKDGKDIATVNIDHHKLFIRALIAVAEKPHLDENDREVSFKLRDYVEDAGATNITMLRKAVEAALATLMNETWVFEIYVPGRGLENVRYNPVISRGAIEKDGNTIHIKFGEDIWRDICTQGRIMAVPMEVLKIKTGRHPHAFFLYLKLAESKNHNRNKLWEGKISMKTAIASCPLIPTEEKVRKSNREYKGRIIKPILNDALSLKGETIGSIKFLLAEKQQKPGTDKEETAFKPISYKKALELDYETARDRLVIFADKWIDYPTAQIDRAQERYAEKLEERAKKQEVKDAEKIIKAEQIREKHAAGKDRQI